VGTGFEKTGCGKKEIPAHIGKKSRSLKAQGTSRRGKKTASRRATAREYGEDV